MPSGIVKHFANKTGKSKEEIESHWDKAKEIVKSQYKDVKETDPDFYAVVTGVLKKMLGLKNEDAAAPAMTTTTMGDLQTFKPKLMMQKRFEQKVKTNKKKPVLIYDPENMGK